jgi:hypothetical protein
MIQYVSSFTLPARHVTAVTWIWQAWPSHSPRARNLHSSRRNFRTRRNTEVYIASVNRPVWVFCWLG